MKNASLKKVYFFTRFERFWHWAQALLVMILLLTGFEIHGAFTLFGFEEAHEIHVYAGWTWIILYVFVIFWMSITSEWKQYIPTTKKVLAVVRYYMIGIFLGDPHPVPKSERAKHNPLQRLVYVSISAIIIPFQMLTGFLAFKYNDWPSWGWADLALGTMAFLHTAGAFAILSFIIVHVYMTTTGHTVFSHIKSMITGWDEIPAGETEGSTD